MSTKLFRLLTLLPGTGINIAILISGENPFSFAIYRMRHLAQVYQVVELSQLEAVETLRHVWLQNYYLDEHQVCLGQKKDQPPSARRITSPYDPEVRCSTKRELTWTGYKVRLTETCDAHTPNLITHVETRPSTESGIAPLDTIHGSLDQKSAYQLNMRLIRAICQLRL
jgi:hypothetical protein